MASSETARSLHSPNYNRPQWVSVTCRVWAGLMFVYCMISAQKLVTHTKAEYIRAGLISQGHHITRGGKTRLTRLTRLRYDVWGGSRPLGRIWNIDLGAV